MEPTLRAAVEHLARPDAYRERAEPVERVVAIETHLSWVFLTDGHAYKLKKPVRTAFVDHRTLGARRRACEEEVALNRRLAPDVYLGLAPLTRTGDRLALGGDGAIVDWLVVMRRLDDAAMLPAAIARGDLSPARPAPIDALADVLSDFYRRARPTGWDGARWWRSLRTAITSTAGELCARGVEAHELAGLAARQLAVVDGERDRLEARVAGGHVVDAHGDLRPEHVCLTRPPVIIDALEFDPDLRVLDAASELSFLGLECDRLGAPWIGARLLARYRARTDDAPPARLLALYASQHATVRALIALRHLDDAPAAEHDRWRGKAAHYLRLARTRL